MTVGLPVGGPICFRRLVSGKGSPSFALMPGFNDRNALKPHKRKCAPAAKRGPLAAIGCDHCKSV
jgi:hypothetical protein